MSVVIFNATSREMRNHLDGLLNAPILFTLSDLPIQNFEKLGPFHIALVFEDQLVESISQFNRRGSSFLDKFFKDISENIFECSFSLNYRFQVRSHFLGVLSDHLLRVKFEKFGILHILLKDAS